MEILITNTIPESAIEVVAERIEKMNLRSTKKGMPLLSLSLGESKPVPACSVRSTGLCLKENHICGTVNLVDVSIVGDTPKMGSFSLIGTIESLAGKPVLMAVPGREFPVSYRDADPMWCDHCRTRRNRNETHVVRSDAGEYFQVGSTCVKDFLGWDVAPFLRWFRSVESIIDEDMLSGGRYVDPLFTPREIVSWASIIVQVDGKYNRSAEDNSTKAGVFDFLFPNKWNQQDRDFYTDHLDAEQSMAIEQATVDALDALDGTGSDWHYNLYTCWTAEHVTTKQVGILSSAVILGLRALDIQVQQRIQKETYGESEHIGNVKERLTLDLVVVGEKTFIGQFGETTLLTFREKSSGNVVKWFASNPPDVTVGDEIVLKATVKAHEEYKGQKQTMVTRCKEVTA
jgi:hypothetical protein